jgi:hypothetical protein
MTNTLLISNTDIVNKIFLLVANKLAIDLEVVDQCNIEKNYDVVFVDENYLDENIIQIKSFAKKTVLVSSKVPDINDFDHIIQKPFLPSKLQNEIENIVSNISQTKQDEEIIQEPINTIDESINEDEELEGLVDFVDSMLDEVEEEIQGNVDDESIILENDLGHGGVLDKNELSKLFEMVNDDVDDSVLKEDSNDWVELADIIDKAIDDVATYEFEDDKPIKLILNKYSMEELRPLFQKLDQNIIDKLTQGKDISLQLRLEK